MRTTDQFHKKPHYYSTHLNYQGPSYSIDLYLDLSKKDNLNALFYEIHGETFWAPYFEFLAQKTKGMGLSELKALDISFFNELDSGKNLDVFFHLPLWLMSAVVDHYRGATITSAQAAKEDFRDLVCRCFGVYRSQIEKVVLKNSAATVMDMTNELNAAAGCVSCKGEIESLIQQTRDRHGLIPGVDNRRAKIDRFGKRVRLKGMTPAQFVLYVDPLIQEWLDKQELSDRYAIEIAAIEGMMLDVKVSPSDKNAQEIVRTLEDYLNDLLSLRLGLSLLL